MFVYEWKTRRVISMELQAAYIRNIWAYVQQHDGNTDAKTLT